jgi:putative membrane protein
MGRPLTSVLAAAVVAVAQLLPNAVMAQGTPPADAYPYGPYMMWGWHGAFLGPLFMVVLTVGVIAVIAVLLRRPAGQGFAQALSRTPLDILKERFARGEIDKAEYEDRRRVLGE